MPRKPRALETVRLTLELLRRIPRTHKVSAPELQRQLSDAGMTRDLRTIQRQLDELSQHFEIERDDSSKPYGYRWKDQAQALSLPGLTPHQSLVLLLAERQLSDLLPAGLMRSMRGYFQQARSNLAPHTSAQSEREWLNKVRVVSTTPPLLPPQVRPGVFEAVSQALYANHWLDVTYVNAGGKTLRARVMPLGLAQQGVRLFLVARFEGYDDERSLALHRLRKAVATGLPFRRPAGFDLQAYDDEGRFGVSLGRRIMLRLVLTRAAGLHLLESPLAADQVVREGGDHLEITATVPLTQQLIRWLRGFGPDLKAVSPHGLLGTPDAPA